jgi:hypothetical protein
MAELLLAPNARQKRVNLTVRPVVGARAAGRAGPARPRSARRAAPGAGPGTRRSCARHRA